MKRNFVYVSLLLSALTTGCASLGPDDSPAQDTTYLGQEPPGSTPILFAPDIIKTDFREGAYAFTPDLREFYLRRRGGKYENSTLVVVRYKDHRWDESVVAPRGGEPFISADGKTLYMGRRYMQRTAAGWSEIKSLDAPLNAVPMMRLTASANGTYYFDEVTNTGGNISYSRLIDGKHESPKTLTDSIDMGIWKAHPFIAPDESYLIWDDQRESGFGSSDLYISYRQPDGSWGAAINLGNEINTEFEDSYGTVTPDGKYFFFVRTFDDNSADIFWMDASFIEALRPKQ